MIVTISFPDDVEPVSETFPEGLESLGHKWAQAMADLYPGAIVGVDYENLQ